MRISTLRWLIPLAALLGAPLRAQEPDPAEAYGIYRPTPADTGEASAPAADTVPAQAAAAPSAGDPADTARQGSVIFLDRVEETSQDTSLTARMDVSRGGGLRREEFPDLRESARLTGRFDLFLELIAGAGYGRMLVDTMPLTLFAPTDSAFARLEPSALERLRGDSAAAATWAAASVVSGDWTVTELLEAGQISTPDGTTIRVSHGPGGVPMVGEAGVVQPDLLARNGRLHGLDRVILPAGDTTTSAVP